MINITVSSLMSAMMSMRDDQFDYYISTIGPDDVCYNKGKEKHLLLSFHDIEDVSDSDFTAPTREHIKQILEFSETLPDEANLLIHCMAGISRSTATAIGVCCQKGMTPSDALSHVRNIREPTLKAGYMVLPNRLMIGYFDDELGLGGELVKVVQEYYDGLPLIGVTTLPNRGGWNQTF